MPKFVIVNKNFVDSTKPYITRANEIRLILEAIPLDKETVSFDDVRLAASGAPLEYGTIHQVALNLGYEVVMVEDAAADDAVVIPAEPAPMPLLAMVEPAPDLSAKAPGVLARLTSFFRV